jgi:hypothetical protein
MSNTVIPTIATVVGSSVSSAVYSSIIATGDVSATTISKGIGLLGKGLGYGADMLIGRSAGNSIRMMGDAGEIITSPAIKTGSRALAFGASVAAGTVAGLLTAGVAHGSVVLMGYGWSAYNKYKEPVSAAFMEAATVATETVKEKESQQPPSEAYEETAI